MSIGRQGHLGGLVRIKSCFSVSPPVPLSQGRGHRGRQLQSSLLKAAVDKDHMAWRDEGSAQSVCSSNIMYSEPSFRIESRLFGNSTKGEDVWEEGEEDGWLRCWTFKTFKATTTLLLSQLYSREIFNNVA